MQINTSKAVHKIILIVVSSGDFPLEKKKQAFL